MDGPVWAILLDDPLPANPALSLDSHYGHIDDTAVVDLVDYLPDQRWCDIESSHCRGYNAGTDIADV
jgi:hypothetical protein